MFIFSSPTRHQSIDMETPTMNQEDIRRFCAELCGWKPTYYRCTDPECEECSRALGGHETTSPNYPTDANAALELVERLRKEEWYVLMGTAEPGFAVSASKNIVQKFCTATSPTIPLAICEVFLRVHGKWKE